MTDYIAARRHAELAAQSVAELLRGGFGKAGTVTYSTDNAGDALTRYDTEATNLLQEYLGKFDSAVGVCGEDLGAVDENGTFWLVDAIGGTGHFLRGTLFASTMISLIHDGEVVAAVIHDFVEGRTFSAAAGAGSHCNGVPLRVSQRPLSQAYLCAEINCKTPENGSLMGRLQRHSAVVSVANYGWEFTMTAGGHMDGCVMKDPWGGPWDFAPGALLVREAGGLVATLGQDTYDYRSLDLIAAPPQIFEALATSLTDHR